jgi:hypothetical protein
MLAFFQIHKFYFDFLQEIFIVARILINRVIKLRVCKLPALQFQSW